MAKRVRHLTKRSIQDSGINTRLLFFLALVFAIIPDVTAAAGTVKVPADYTTIQQAVNAVQGTVNGKVIINSSGTFTESITITESVIIEAGVGYTPTVRGASSSSRTIYFNPDSTLSRSLTLKNLIVLPRAGIGPGSGDHIISIQNAGTGETHVLIDGLTLNDPENAGPTGISIRSGYGMGSGGANHVTIQDTQITLGGGPGYGLNAVFMGELGTLTLSALTVEMSHGSGTAFDIRGSQGSGITFLLEDSTFDLTAPSAAYTVESGRLIDLVTATIQNNTFNLFSNTQGSATGIITGWGEQIVTMDANRFNGFGPKTGSAYSAVPFGGDTGYVFATNNLVRLMSTGFQFNPQSGTPGGVVYAVLTNNTIDDCEDGAVVFSLNDNTAINANIMNNLFTNNLYGFRGYVGAGSELNVINIYNGFYHNAMGATDGEVTIGSNTLYEDPLYVSRAANNYHLRAISPAIGKGYNGATMLPCTDIDGNPRIFGSSVDLGAFEFQKYTLTVTLNGSGNIVSIPAGIDCTSDDISSTEICDHEFNEYENVTLTATPVDGTTYTSHFIQWSSCFCSGSDPECSLVMDSDKSVNADFGALGLPAFALIPPDAQYDYGVYPWIQTPVEQPDPSLCKPIAAGDLTSGFLSLHVSFPIFSMPCDVYLAFYSEDIDPDTVYMITAGNLVQTYASGFDAWMENSDGNIDEYLFGDIPLSAFDPGTYYLFAAVTPAGTGNLDKYYLWGTYFTVP